ncbi:MAG: tryptophan-rich sensory protein [Atopobiaceae bacterium]|nr:tryptophan-rich sensory protein [Atopobiaceae bacterium]
MSINARSTESVQHDYVALVGMTALPLVVGGIASFLTSDAMAQFDAFNQPPLAPPAWLFPVAWTILYVLMGLASYLIYIVRPANNADASTRRAALVVYGIQLALNFAWSLVFFGAHAHWVAFGLLMGMWVLIIALIVLAMRINRTAGWLLVPYVAWTTFAAYLNVMIAILN